jgi:hypothetical protein
MNAGNRPHKIDFSNYSERTGGFTRGVDIPTGQSYSLDQPVDIPARTMWVMKLEK